MALLRPSELARMWELHPKTVYLWIREGRLPAMRTPGAQYRVRSDDARVYAERHELPPLPRALMNPAGTVAAIGKPGPSLRALARACKSRGTSLVTWESPLEGLLAVAGETPDVLALDARCEEVKLVDALRALRRTAKTAALPVVIYDAAAKLPLFAKLGVDSVYTRGKSDEAAQAVIDLLEARASTGRRASRATLPRDRG